MTIVAPQTSWPELGVGLGACVMMSAALMVTGLAGPMSVLGILVYLAGAALIAVHWHSRRLGAANQVTLLRLVGTSMVAGLLIGQLLQGNLTPVTVAMVVIGSVCLILDGVDGHLARSRGLVSAFGARFDMETDAVLLMVLSIAVPVFGVAGWWVLAIGLMRYLYVLASFVLRWLQIPLPFSMARKVVAVSQGIALLLALTVSVLPLPEWAATPPLVIALATLCWSFGRDIVWQWRHRSESGRHRLDLA